MRPPTFLGGGETGATRNDEEALLVRTLQGLVGMKASFVGRQTVETDIRGDTNSISNLHMRPKVGEPLRGTGKILTPYQVRAESTPFYSAVEVYRMSYRRMLTHIAHRLIFYRLPLKARPNHRHAADERVPRRKGRCKFPP